MPRERQQHIGEGAGEEQQQRRYQQQRQPDERPHPLLRGPPVLILDDCRREAAHAQRPFVAGCQLADGSLSVGRPLIARVDEANGGYRYGSAVRVRPGQRGEGLWHSRGVADGVDLRLGDRLETIHLQRSSYEVGGRDYRIGGRQQSAHGRVAGDVVQQDVHLREPVGRESVAAEEERYDTDLTGVSEVLVDFLRRCDEGVVGRKEGEVGAFRRRGSERSPYDHSHGD